MEKKFLNNKIKKNFLNKDFIEWNKDTIDYLVMLISINKFSKYHNILFLLLNDYIIWYKNKQNEDKELYTLDELIKIKNDLYLILYKELEHKDRIYINDFGEDDIIINNYFTLENIVYFIFFIIGILILRNILLPFNNNLHNGNNTMNLSKNSGYKEIIENNRNFSVDSSLFSGLFTKENLTKIDLLNNPIVNNISFINTEQLFL
jgi:hypothetical protein